jgi:hypothetical protein
VIFKGPHKCHHLSGARLMNLNNVAITRILVGIIAIIATSISGCATPKRNFDSATGSLHVPVSFVDAHGDSIPADDRPNRWAAKLGAVPGEIFGDPRYPPKRTEDLGTSATVAINLSTLRAELDRQSATISVAAAKAGWRIDPGDTRIARLATAITTDTSRRFGVGFMDSVSKNRLLLVFFDRPCRLTGTVVTPENGTTTYTIEVVIESTGLHWLQITTKGSESHLTNAALELSQLLFIAVPFGPP